MDLNTDYSHAEILCKLGVAAHTFNLCSWEAQAGGLGVWGHLQLHSNVEASLGYLRPHLNKLKSQRCVVFIYGHQCCSLNGLRKVEWSLVPHSTPLLQCETGVAPAGPGEVSALSAERAIWLAAETEPDPKGVDTAQGLLTLQSDMTPLSSLVRKGGFHRPGSRRVFLSYPAGAGESRQEPECLHGV